MIDVDKPKWASAVYETHAGKATGLVERCTSTWGLIEACGRKLTDFPEFAEVVSELTALPIDLQRAAAFVRNFDPNEDDPERQKLHLEAAEKIEGWWIKFEHKVEGEIQAVGRSLGPSGGENPQSEIRS